MEDALEGVDIKPKNMYSAICIVQTICVAVILITIIIIKFVFKDGYQDFKKWYNKHMMEETVITADFSEAE